MTWYLAPSLDHLRDEVNARWPNRSRVSDGTKGDSAHASRVSDHNPDSRGCVRAIDITNAGIDVDALVEAAIAHPATKYVISRGFIYSETYGFAKRRFDGPAHDKHVHVSIRGTLSAERSTSPWLRSAFPLPAGHVFGYRKSATVHNGTEGPVTAARVRAIQRRVRAKETGVFDYQTALRVKAWKIWKGLGTNSDVGPATWAAMFPAS